MNKILLALALAVPLMTMHEAQAAPGDFWVDFNIASYHTTDSGYCYEGKCEDFNQANHGLGISYEMDSLIEWNVGFFRNSYDEHSNYAAMKFKHDFTSGDWTVTPGLNVGFVTGYDDTEVQAAPLQVMALPSVAVAYQRVRVVVGYIPFSLISDDTEVDVITFQAGFRF